MHALFGFEPKPGDRLGFTGTREGMRTQQLGTLVRFMKDMRLAGVGWAHFGVCRGSDAQAFDIWHGLGGKAIGHPPSDKRNMHLKPYNELRVPKPYHVRDRDLVDESHFLVATPLGLTEELRSGTWTTIRYARKLARPIIILYANGTYHTENI